jgi:endo-1,3(4)-beta-glucanase
MMNENSATSVSALLMLSLPHHARSLPSETILSSSEFDLAYVCIKGAMTPVVSDTWAYDIALNAPDFDDVDMMVYAKGLAPSVRNLIMESVQKDLTRVLPTLDENIYGFGKQTARLAQLAHIADMMDYSAFAQGNHTQNVTKPTASPAFADAKSKLHSFLVSFFDGQETDKLVFDAKFGGIVSQDGLYNSEADFGNGRCVVVLGVVAFPHEEAFVAHVFILHPLVPGTTIIIFIMGKFLTTSH